MAEKQKKSEAGENCFLNRELSWLAFNERVLLEAADSAVPLLERLKFLSIYQSNLDEFYRVRIGIHTHRAILTPDKRDELSGLLPDEQIREALLVTAEQQALAESVWKNIRAQLKENGVDVLDFKKISKVDELMSKKLFGDLKDLLFPKVIGVDQSLPFLWGEEAYVIGFLGRGSVTKLAIIPLHRIPAYQSFEIEGRQKIVLTAQLIRHFLPLLLKKETVLQSAVVKVTRNADVFLSDMEASVNEDLRHKMSTMLTKRRREQPVRVQIWGKLTDAARALLIKKLRVPEQNVFSVTVPYDLSFRSCISGPDSLRYPERRPVREIGLRKGEYFRYIEKHDLLLSYPFQSMLPFVDLIYEAADDPEVLSIKITLYRMSASSKIAAALAYAADRGKDVLCLLELRARFDEQNNIDYSELLEDAGCRVIYGLPEHKVHSKLCVITREHEGNLEYITQVGTGNYNEVTGEQYTDLSLITSDKAAGLDGEAAFASLAAGELPDTAETLWIAPLHFRDRVLELLERERAKGSEGRVSIKVNSMNNPEIMEELIRCSQAGVRIELFIRGICCLRPGIPGKTENVTVKSVVGRWLEHSRIYRFGEGEDERLFIGSGDLLTRNLERRVEAFMEVRSPETRRQVDRVLTALREDREKSRTMLSDGRYVREKGGEGTSSQEALYRYFCGLRFSVTDEPESAAPPVKAVRAPAPEAAPEPVPAPERTIPPAGETAQPGRPAAAEQPKPRTAPGPAARPQPPKPKPPAAAPKQEPFWNKLRRGFRVLSGPGHKR